MKKWIMSGLIVLAINGINNKVIQPNNLNSKNLLNYIKENNLLDKVTEVCSEDLCRPISISNFEYDIKEFIKQNINYLKDQNLDASIEAELKGFKIDNIKINSYD